MDLKEKQWQRVERYWEKNGERCPDCHFCQHLSQRHPYGMGTAEETWQECGLLGAGSDPLLCPGAFPDGIDDTEEDDDAEAS